MCFGPFSVDFRPRVVFDVAVCFGPFLVDFSPRVVFDVGFAGWRCVSDRF